MSARFPDVSDTAKDPDPARTLVGFRRVAVTSAAMPARKPPSAAMLALCERANDEGRRRPGQGWKAVTPRMIERWTGERLIPLTDRPGRGRGLGREPMYTDEHVVAVVELAQLVHRYRSTATACAILFMRGRVVHVDALRASYIKLLDRFDKTIQDLAEKQRQELQVDPDEPIDIAELAEPLLAQHLASNPDTQELRSHLKAAGLGIQSTLEIISALMTQILSAGQASPSDLEELQRRLSLPVIPEPLEDQRWLPSDDQIREGASVTAMRKGVDTATVDDFEYARAGALTMDRLLNTPEAQEALAGYGLAELAQIVESMKGEEVRATLLLLPLIFRVKFNVDLLPVADLPIVVLDSHPSETRNR